MSRKKFDNKVELLQELYARLEELRGNLDMDLTGIEFARLEEKDYSVMVEGPFNELLVSVETFLTNVNNGIYEEDIQEEFDESEDY
jgi:hypothetical protein